MHPAVELLMKRMESNPDEFIRGHTTKDRTWGALIERYKEYMTKEDRDALRAKYSEIQMGQLHREVMAELLREPREQTAFDFQGLRDYVHELHSHQHLGNTLLEIKPSTIKEPPSLYQRIKERLFK